MKNHRYMAFSSLYKKIKSIRCYISCLSRKLPSLLPKKTNNPKILEIFVHRTVADHALHQQPQIDFCFKSLVLISRKKSPMKSEKQSSFKVEQSCLM